jgi:hypothetical protein
MGRKNMVGEPTLTTQDKIHLESCFSFLDFLEKEVPEAGTCFTRIDDDEDIDWNRVLGYEATEENIDHIIGRIICEMRVRIKLMKTNFFESQVEIVMMKAGGQAILDKMRTAMEEKTDLRVQSMLHADPNTFSLDLRGSNRS